MLMNNIINTILLLSVSGSFISIVLILLKPLYKNKFSNKWYYYVWLIVIVRLIVPFGLPINMISSIPITNTYKDIFSKNEAEESSTSQTKQQQNDSIQTEIIATEQSIANQTKMIAEEQSITSSKPNILGWFQIVTPFLEIFWITVTIFLLSKKLFDYMIFLRLIYSCIKPIYDLEVVETYRVTNLSLGIKKQVPVFTHPIISSPMLIGFCRPIIILPDKQLENKSDLKYIFMHELTHLKRFDIYYKWLMQIVLCVHWFNPLIYIAVSEADKACELSCDEAVIKRLPCQEQRAYGDTLIRSLELIRAFHNPAGSLTLAENSKLMKERLSNIMTFRKKSKFVIFVSALLTFVICTIGAFTAVQAKTIDTTSTSTYSVADLQNIQESKTPPIPPIPSIPPINKNQTTKTSDINTTNSNIILDLNMKTQKRLAKNLGKFYLGEKDTVDVKIIRNASSVTNQKLENMKTWNGSAIENKTDTGIVFKAENSTGNIKKYDEREADKRALQIINNSGTWSNEIDTLIPYMSSDSVEKIVNIYLERHLFPHITTAEGAKQVAITISFALNYMNADAEINAQRIISTYTGVTVDSVTSID